jgi:putative heme-binding domain-containing protein
MRGCSVVVSGVAVLALALVGMRVSAQAPAQDHPGQYPVAEVAAGQRAYGVYCVGCHGPAGNAMGNVDLRRGPLPRAATDAALRAVITSGFPTSGMPAFKLEPADLNGLVAFIRSGLEAAPVTAPVAGDAARGRSVFETRGNCLGCHRVGNVGQFMGPDLTEIGRLRTPEALLQKLLDPTTTMQPINRPVRAVTADGTTYVGRRLNEDLFTVQIVTNEGRLVSFVKPELREWTVGTVSTMPSYRDTLTEDELVDLVGYLSSLKGGRP